MKVRLNPWQLTVANDKHRFRIICAGRRSGKSVLARLTLLKWAVETVGTYYLVSPTYRQAKSIHWVELRKEVPRQWIAKTNETELSIQLKNGSVIELKGAENPDALRGVALHGLVIDEIASIRNWDWLWQEVLRATLTDYEAPVIFISTPKGFNHFYELYEQGQTEDKLYKSWKFTSYDNPYIPKGEIDNAKAELTEDTFQQEYMANFRKYTGLVYKEFQREVHVIEPFEIPEGFQVYRTIDFGSTNPTACLWVACDGDDNWFIVSEHYEVKSGIDYHAGVINSDRYSKRVVATYGDPSGAQWITEFAQRGIYITPANKEVGTNFNSWVRFGIEKVSERLKVLPGHTVEHVSSGKEHGLPKLFVFSTCQNTIKEFETYRWKEKSVTQAQDLNEPDVPEKANDHACFAEGTKVEVPTGELLFTKCTGKRKVYKFMGSKVTTDHPYLTPRGFITLDSLRYSDRIVIWRKSLLTELSLDAIQTHHMLSLGSILHLLQRNIGAIKGNFYTGIYGKRVMERYPKVFISTIKTTVQLITICLTSNVYHLKNIMADTIKRCFLNGKRISQKKQDQRLSNGINLKKLKYFIKELPEICGKLRNGLQKFVRFVQKNIKHHSQHEVNTALLIAGLPQLGEEKVYAHVSSSGFFLANGVVVSNCDALRYFAVSYTKHEQVYNIPKRNWTIA